MNVIKHHDKIWEVENFLSSSEIDYFLDLAKNSSADDWNDPNAPDHWKSRNLNLEYTENVKALEEKIASTFYDYEQIHDLRSLLRYRTGDILGEHRDNANASDFNNIYGVVLYLNDDYQGGEIYYSELGLELKPTAGTMVVHAAGILHGVKQVLGDNVRYVLTSFVKGSEATKFMGEVNAV
jgi:hypothetical protein